MRNRPHIISMTVQPEFKPGDLPPKGYLAWHEWAEVQRKAGIKQVQCGRCALWKTPQELSGETMVFTGKNRRGQPVKVESPVCSECQNKLHQKRMKPQ